MLFWSSLHIAHILDFTYHLPRFSLSTPLLKHLTIRPLIRLPPLLNRIIPAPLVFHKLLILLLFRVQLGKAIALIVGRDIECRLFFLAADDEGTANEAVVGLAVDRGAAEDVFAGGFEAGEETTCGGSDVSNLSLRVMRTRKRQRWIGELGD
jgi:hypothetical protein